MTRQSLTLLGCNGSIGVNTLDVVRRHPGRYRIFGLCAHSCRPPVRAVRGIPAAHAVLRDASTGLMIGRAVEDRRGTEVLHGVDSLIDLATHPEVDTVMAPSSVLPGLAPTFGRSRRGKKILLANKEALVMAGELFMAAMRESGGRLLPVDSEQMPSSSPCRLIFFHRARRCGVRRILLTASGGRFRTTPVEALAEVTPESACAHPNWVMGRKISVDSATMMNKGLKSSRPAGYSIASLSASRWSSIPKASSIRWSITSMAPSSPSSAIPTCERHCPRAGLSGADRIGVEPLDLSKLARLDFEAPDFERFPASGWPTMLSPPEEPRQPSPTPPMRVAVAAFLDRKRFLSRNCPGDRRDSRSASGGTGGQSRRCPIPMARRDASPTAPSATDASGERFFLSCRRLRGGVGRPDRRA